MSTAAGTDMFSFAGTMTASYAPIWVSNEVLWLLIVGFAAAFLLAFSVGANDVANSFGTTVGAKVLTLRQACLLATVFETSGAVLLGAKVGEMIRKGIIDVKVYQAEDGAKLLMMGEVSAMFGAGIWQLIATALKVPVSGTHSIVGACIGFSLVAVGSSGVNWHNLGFIVASWFISPALSGIMAVLLFFVVQRFIVKSDVPLKNGLKMLPYFYAFTVGINVFSILYSGAPLLGLKDLPVWGTVLIAFATMLLVGFATQCYAVPKLRKEEGAGKCKGADTKLVKCGKGSASNSCNSLHKQSSSDDPGECDTKLWVSIKDESSKHDTEKNEEINEEKKFVRFEEEAQSSSVESLNSNLSEIEFTVKLMTSDTSIEKCDELEPIHLEKKSLKSKKAKKVEDVNDEEDPLIVRKLFSSLQVLTACFASFAHGGNDVSNAIGPLIALWIVFWSGEVVQAAFTPWYLLLYGGFGISIGLWLLGRRVMQTIGEDLTKMTPSRGFCIELMTAFTVLIASNLGIPISTTHCKVGAVVSIGWFRARSAVQWSIVRNIAFAWCVTLPISGLLSALTMFVLMQF